MAKTLEKDGIRVGFIIGGILALLLATFLAILYLPIFMVSLGLPELWSPDLLAGIIPENILSLFYDFGLAAILLGLFLVYFVCLFARRSSSATMFRLVCMFSCLGLLLPVASLALLALVEIDISTYANYGVIGLFALSLIFYIIGHIMRAKNKFHKNKASTVLVFAATFWLLFSGFFAISAIGVAFGIEALNTALAEITALLSVNMPAIIAIFFLICAIWMFITVPHYARVEDGKSSNTSDGKGKPKVLSKDESAMALSPEEEKIAVARSEEAIKESAAPATQPLGVYPDRPAVANSPTQSQPANAQQNPYRRQPLQGVPTSPQMANANGYTNPQQIRPMMAPQNGMPATRQVNPMQAPNQPMAPQGGYNQMPRQPMPGQGYGQPMQQPMQPRQPMQNPNMPPRPMAPTNIQNGMNAPRMPNQPTQPRPAMPNQPARPAITPRPAQPIRPMPNQPMAPQGYGMPAQPMQQPQGYGPQPQRPMAPNGYNNNYPPVAPQNNPNNVIPNGYNNNNGNNGNNGNR